MEIVNLIIGISTFLYSLTFARKVPNTKSKRRKQEKKNLIVGDLLGGGSNELRASFLIAYFLPLILILIIDFLLLNLVFKEFLILSAGIIFVGLVLAPSRKIWHLLALLVPYFLLSWVLRLFPTHILSLLVIPIVTFSIYAVFHFYLLKDPNMPPRLQGVRWIAPVSGLSLWRFQLTYVIFGSIFIFLPETWSPVILLFAVVIVLILWVVVQLIVVILGLKKARNLTLLFLGTLVKK